MKKKNVIVGSALAAGAAVAGFFAFKNRDKIKGKVKEIKDKKCKCECNKEND